MILNAVQIVITIFILLAIGFVLAKIGWFDEHAKTLFSRLVTKVGLPAMIIHNLFGSYTKESLIQSAPGLVVPFASMIIGYGIAALTAHLFRVPAARRGVYCALCTFSNSVFVGLPICVALFGEQVTPYTLLYYIANTTLFWTIGVYFVRKDGQNGKKTVKSSLGQTLKRVFSLPLVVFMSCTALILLGFKPPKFFLDSAKYVSGIVTPISLFFTGIVLFGMSKQGFSWQKGYGSLLFSRFLIAPALVVGISMFFVTIPPLMNQAFIMQAAMPCMAQTPIIAADMGADSQYAAGGVALTTLLSLLFIPLYMMFIGYLAL